MEREIGSVAAASAMRGFRYMAFPPIVFEAPSRPTTLLRAPGIQAALANALATVTRQDGGIGMVARAADPLPAPPHGPASTHGPAIAPPPAAPPRRFALLHEVSAELHRQRRP